ncbi:MAG: VanZ family protein [Candidatus Fermentibacteraceae bacterium]|nr:VanZ family protein [Candidatus Fermentibacteraceae bacterium]MBN2608172.1 VanZ family protein [Candidatus Fermentibacteraceae bacterium]
MNNLTVTILRRGFLLLVAGGIFYLSSQPSLSIVPPLFPNQDKVFHMLEYLFLFVAMFTNRMVYRGPYPFGAMFAVGLLYAVTDEIHQSFVPGRDCSVLDLAADAAGLAIGLVICLSYLRKR